MPCISFSQLTLSRPKGPPSRRKPRHHSDPDSAGPSSGVTADSRKRYSHDILGTWSSELEGTQQVLQEKDGSISAHPPSVQSRKVSTGNSTVHDREMQEKYLLPSGSSTTDPNPRRMHSRTPARPDSSPHSTTGSSTTSHLPNSTPSMSTDPVPRPLASSDSTPSGSPSMHNKVAASQAVPQLDLMSLAPEQKQVVGGVRRGWSEGGGVSGNRPAETVLSIKEIAHKMHG